MDSRIVRIEVKLEMIEKTLEKTTDILEELVKSEIKQQETEKRLTKLENSLAKLNWIVISTVATAIIALVIK
jgi:hypothetical protein